MTNKEAAKIIKQILTDRSIYRRGHSPSGLALCIDEAFMKAIDVLESTPDKDLSTILKTEV